MSLIRQMGGFSRQPNVKYISFYSNRKIKHLKTQLHTHFECTIPYTTRIPRRIRKHMVVKGEIRYSQEMGKHDEDVDENNILRFSVNRPSSRFHVGWWPEFDIANEHIAQLCLLGTISTAKWRIWTYSEIIRDRNTTAQKISCSETLKHFDIQRKTRLGVCLINSVTVARNKLPLTHSVTEIRIPLSTHSVTHYLTQ